MEHHIVFIDVHVADFEGVPFVTKNLEAVRSVKLSGGSLAGAHGQRNLFQARLRLSAPQQFRK
jgi:hypothetical protein